MEDTVIKWKIYETKGIYEIKDIVIRKGVRKQNSKIDEIAKVSNEFYRIIQKFKNNCERE
jgi:hypothetical protein